jgi:hypothetical protein
MDRAEIVAKLKAKGLLRPSAIALVLSNLVPVFGVLALGWDAFPIVVLYCLESAVIGFYNVLRMAWCTDRFSGHAGLKVFLILFFGIHYGGFCVFQAVFVFLLYCGKSLVQTLNQNPTVPPLVVLWQTLARYQLGWALLALLVSHGVSFVTNYLRQGEYRQAVLLRLMFQPYARVLVFQVTVVMGGFALMYLDAPNHALVLLVLLKIILDLRAHLRERAKLGSRPAEIDMPAGIINNLLGRRR